MIRRVEFVAHGWKIARDVEFRDGWEAALFLPEKKDGQTLVRGCVTDGWTVEYPAWGEFSEPVWKSPDLVPSYVKSGFAAACKILVLG